MFTALAWNPFTLRTYVLNYLGSSVSILSDSLHPGVEEMANAKRRMSNGRATVVRGVLVLDAVGSRQNVDCRAELQDISGRKVLDLRPGANDVSGLAPGVYFVRAVSCGLSAASCQKVVVTR